MDTKQLANKYGLRADIEHDDTLASPEFPEANHWRVTLKLGRKRMTTEFHTGYGITGQPKPAEVLDCLLSDASSVEGVDFEDWCDELGFDRDSRRAERIYKVSERQTVKLHRFLNGH